MSLAFFDLLPNSLKHTNEGILIHPHLKALANARDIRVAKEIPTAEEKLFIYLDGICNSWIFSFTDSSQASFATSKNLLFVSANIPGFSLPGI